MSPVALRSNNGSSSDTILIQNTEEQLTRQIGPCVHIVLAPATISLPVRTPLSRRCSLQHSDFPTGICIRPINGFFADTYGAVLALREGTAIERLLEQVHEIIPD